MTLLPFMTHRRAISLAMCVLMAAFVLALSGCGKKPKAVDPPQGKAEDHFPQTYPNPSTDPKPGKAGTGFSFP